MRHICKWSALGICMVLALLTFFLVVPGLFGIYPLIVQSRSMEPVYPVGSLLYVKESPSDGSKLLEGETATFYLPDHETLVTHRVVSIDWDREEIRTKGDANEFEDELSTSFSNVKGIPFMCIPYMGYIAGYLSGTLGKFGIFLMVILVFILSWMDGSMFQEQKKMQKI